MKENKTVSSADELFDKGSMLVKDYKGHEQYLMNKGTFVELAEQHFQERLKEIMPSDEEIKEMMTKEHYSQESGRYRRVYLDRVQGAKMLINHLKQE